MHKPLPPLNALRAFEIAARHLSLTKAAAEMHVTPGALSHQIRGLEEFLGVRLFERGTRSIALTSDGKRLYPGLQAGFGLIRDAVEGLRDTDNEHVLVLSTSPGLTSKWLASRLHRFADAYPDIEVRVSSSFAIANFGADGVDAAIRSQPAAQALDPALHHEKLFDIAYAPVCSPRLLARFERPDAPGVLRQVPLIHDDSLAGRSEIPDWKEWLAAAGMEGGDIGAGLHFNSPDHALDATLEGAGLLLAHTILAHDDLRSGRLVRPFATAVLSRRAYYFVYPQSRRKQRRIQAFQDWLQEEILRLDRQLLGTG